MAFDRRGFLQLAVGGVVGVLATPIPWKIADDISIWTQNWSWIPRLPKGAVSSIPFTSKLCPTSSGMLVQTVGGQPFRTTGNPASPLSLGGISALALNEVQLHYSPARTKSPMKRSGQGFVATTWDDGVKTLSDRLAGLKGQAGKVAVVSGDETGSINQVLSGLVAGLGSAEFFMMPSDGQAAFAGWQKAMGGAGQVGYDIDNADMVVALQADILDSWGPAVKNARAYNASHPVAGAPTASYVFIGPRENRTAVACDRYIPVKAGTEAIFALGLAAALIGLGVKTSAPDAASFASFVTTNYSPAAVSEITGTPVAEIERLAADLLKAKRPLVIPGSDQGQMASISLFLAGMGVNSLLNRMGMPGGVVSLPEPPVVVKGAMTRSEAYRRDLISYLTAIDAGSTPAPEVLLVYEANPAYSLPPSAAKGLAKIPMIVTFSPFMDETSLVAHLVLPTSMPLERMDDVYTPYGVGFACYSQNRPVMKPVHDTRPTADVVLAVAKTIGLDLGATSYKEVLAAIAAKLGAGFAPYAAKGAKAPAGDALKVLAGGGTMVKAPQTGQPLPVSMGSAALAQLKPQAPAKDALVLIPVARVNVGTSTTGIPPHNVATIDGNTLQAGAIMVHMNKATADKQGLKEGDTVKISGPAGEIKAKLHLYESMANGTIAAPLGFGHVAWDEYNRDKGENVYKVMSVSVEAGTGLSVWAGSSVKVAKI